MEAEFGPRVMEMEDFLTKPVRPMELRARMSSMFELKQYWDQLAIRNQLESSFPDVGSRESVTLEATKELPLVLLVEDNENDAILITHILEQKPLQLGFVKNGAEALAFIQSNRVNLILLDILLPDINSFEVCRRIKKMESGKTIPIIVVTCPDDLESRITCVESERMIFWSSPPLPGS
jgi:CheY-like chemotaxis protein